MKIAVLATLLAGASAFAPASFNGRSATVIRDEAAAEAEEAAEEEPAGLTYVATTALPFLEYPPNLAGYVGDVGFLQDMLEGDTTYDYMTVALLSLILGLGTAFFAIGLRQIFTDFAITISVVVMTALRMSKSKSSMFQTLSPLPSLAALKIVVTTPTDCPDQAEPWGRRPWIVDLYDLNGNTEVIFIAAALGIPAFILTFLDNGITWHIVNQPSNRLAHGDAYNYDTVTSAIMVSW